MKQRHGDKEREQEREGHAHISWRDGKSAATVKTEQEAGRKLCSNQRSEDPGELSLALLLCSFPPLPSVALTEGG